MGKYIFWSWLSPNTWGQSPETSWMGLAGGRPGWGGVREVSWPHVHTPQQAARGSACKENEYFVSQKLQRTCHGDNDMDGVCMVGLVSPSGHAKQNRKGENVLWWGHRYRCPHHRAQTGIGLLKHGKRAQEVPRGLKNCCGRVWGFLGWGARDPKPL